MTADYGCAPWSPAALAREWASAIGTTAYVPMSPEDIERYLLDLVQRLVAALSCPKVDTEAASDVGARLVSGHFIGEQSLSRTLEVLARTLPATAGVSAAGTPTVRVIELLGALAAGYTWALRDRIFGEQEALTRALLAARQHAEREQPASTTWLHEVFDSSPIGIILSEPGGRIEQTNPSLEGILGYPSGELLGSELSGLLMPEDRPSVLDRYQRLCRGQESRFRVRCRLRHKDGGPAWVYLAASVLHDAEQQPQYLATMIDDLTELHLLQQWSGHQELYDPQTGLPNRHYLVSHLEQVMRRLEPSAVLTLLHLDLDGFSAINDGMGQCFGDRVLDMVANRLRRVVAGQRAMVARVGADEFAILIEPGDCVPDISRLTEAINTELDEPVSLDGTAVAVTATIGVVQRRIDGADHTELLRAASATLRRLRASGKRQWAVFDADIDATDRAELRLAAAMPGALETGQLRVEYQPVMILESPRLVGIEVLLSWQHPELGVVSHERCAQLAEQTGVVHAIGQWLLHTAADQAVSWQCHVPVMVNLTPSQAQDACLVAKVRTVLAQTGLRPDRLELRMPVGAIRTSTDLLAGQGGAKAEDNLQSLAELGVRVGLYDFAGDIGGLHCLSRLPVRTVQIARPIAQQVIDDPSRILSQAVHALVHIVRSSGINVVANPVESIEQSGCWQWVGANWGVGTLFGPPGPPQQIESLLHAQLRS